MKLSEQAEKGRVVEMERQPANIISALRMSCRLCSCIPPRGKVGFVSTFNQPVSICASVSDVIPTLCPCVEAPVAPPLYISDLCGAADVTSALNSLDVNFSVISYP